MQPVLEMQSISKQFPGVRALKDVSFAVFPGEVHALIGENGAGKSTLMKILAGIYHPDAGQIVLRGQSVRFSSPHAAWVAGISTIHQELMLVPQLTVAENIFLGKVPQNKLGLVARRRMLSEARHYLERLEVDVDPKALLGDLPVAIQQMVEIAKALSYDAEIIIMDEPTSALSKHEIDVLFERIARLKSEGRCVVFISHKLDEIFRIADRITVLRDGEHIATDYADRLTSEQLIQMMVGRDIQGIFQRSERQPGAPILEVRNLTIHGQFYDINFTLHAGEIVGFAGLVGSGRTDLVRALFGAEPVESGDVLLAGEPVDISSPQRAIAAGMGLVPENRKEQGLFLQMSVRENIVIAQTDHLAHNGLLNFGTEQQIASDYIARLDVRTPSAEQDIVNLSGGNQQKTILARWLALNPRVLIVDEPTRGIDIGAKAEIHAILNDLADNGVGIVFVSSEMEEVLGISDRILVMREGRISGEFAAAQASQELLGAAAIGLETSV